MPMSFLDGALSRVLDGVESKSFVKAFKKAKRAGGKVGNGIVIDTRGRKWNSSLHPRDSRGRFIETGGIAKVWGGGRGRVIRSLGNGRVELRMADGSPRTVLAKRITMVSRPNGGRPVKDDGSRKSRALVMAEDTLRKKHTKRGDGVHTPDENDRDGDGIPNHLDHTPDGFIDGDKPDWEDDGLDDDLADGPRYNGKRPQARPKVIRDEFKTVAEVKAHWKGEDRRADDPDAPHNPEAAALADKLESAQLSEEGEHIVARVDGQWMVFQSDTGKPVAGHNGSRRLTDKPSALIKANELDDVFDPEPARKTAAGKGPKVPRGHRDAGGGYSIKDVKPAGGDLKQVELYDKDGALVASTTSRIDSKPGQAAGWRGEAHGIDIKAGNEGDFVERAKQIDQAVKAERDPAAIDRIADHFWRVSVAGNGGDEKKAARAVRAFVSQKRANGKGSTTTPMGRRDEKINKALEVRAAAAEKGQPVPTAAPRAVAPSAAPAPAKAVPAAPAPVDAPNVPEAPQRPHVAAAAAPRPDVVNANVPDSTDEKIDRLTEKVDELAAKIDDSESGSPFELRDEFVTDVEGWKAIEDKVHDKDHLDDLTKQMRDAGKFVGDPLIVEETQKGPLLTDGYHRLEAARRAGLTKVPVERYKDTPEGRMASLKRLNAAERRKSEGDAPTLDVDVPNADEPAAPKADAPKRPKLEGDQRVKRERMRRYNTGRVTALVDNEHIEVGRLENDPNRKGKVRAVHSDGTILAGGTREDALRDLADHHNGDATREYKTGRTRKPAAAKIDDDSKGKATPKGEDTPKADEAKPAAAPKSKDEHKPVDWKAEGEKVQADRDAEAEKNKAPEPEPVDWNAGAEKSRDELDKANGVTDAQKKRSAEEHGKVLRDGDNADGKDKGDAPADGDHLDELDAAHPDDPAIKKHTDAARQARKDGDSEKAEHHTGIADALSNARKKKAEKDAEAAKGKDDDKADLPPETDDLDADLASFEQWAIDNNYDVQDLIQARDRGRDPKELHDALGEIRADDRTMERLDSLQERLGKPDAFKKPADRDARDGDKKDPNPTPAATLKETPKSAEGTDKNGDADRGGDRELRDEDRAVLEDVPAESGRRDGEPDGVLPATGRSGEVAGSGSGEADRPGGRAAGESDVPGRAGGARGGSSGGRGGSDGGPRVPDAGAGDGDSEAGGSRPARVGGRRGGNADGAGAPKRPVAKAAGKPKRFKPRGQEDLARKGEKNKLADNIAALRLLRQLAEEDRQATPEEQKILARWAGWGALPDVFNTKQSDYATDEARKAVKELLSKDEYREARANTKNAHYTDAAVVQSVWSVMKDLGFTQGDVLEPGSGSGNFMGFAPDGAHMTGVELDPTTAAISRHLYPDAEIHNESFGKSPFREGVFDAVVGNVPFGNFPVYDPVYNKDNSLSIHDHFILKSLAETKPGGIATIVTSSFTLDKQSPEARQKIAKYGDLLGAVRLPSGAHKDAAGTDVVTDVLVFRRRKDTDAPASKSWLESSPAKHTDGSPVFGIKEGDGNRRQQTINDYFAENPDKVLGTIVDGGYNGIAVKGDGSTQSKLRDALADIAKKANAADRGWNVDTDPDVPKVAKRNVGSDRDGRISFVSEGPAANGKGTAYKFEVNEGGRKVELSVPATQQKELRDLLDLRDAADELIDAETAYTDKNPTVAAARKRLNRLYDQYVAKNGAVTRFDVKDGVDKDGNPTSKRQTPPVMAIAKRDEGSAALFALEHGYDPETKKWRKADLFHKRVIDRDRQVATKADTPEDALALASERGETADAETIGRLLGVDPKHAESLIVGQGLAFIDPDGANSFIPADIYKSGNIRKKLAQARDMAAKDPRFEQNVKALEDVMPADAKLEDIPKQLGASWIGPDVVQGFVRHLAKNESAEVTWSPEEGWKSNTPTRGRNTTAESEWATPDRNLYELVTAVLKQQHKNITVTRKNEDGTRWTDKKASELATAAAANIEAEWEDYLWSNPKIAETITSRYNERFRSILPRVADQRSRSYPGMAAGITMRPHQNGGINRIVSDESVLLEHVVGSGKTYALTAGAMELRRLGLADKIALNVPNTILSQWLGDIRKLYPNAKVLAVDSDSIGKGPAARRRFAEKVRNSDWDLVVFTGETFESIPVSEKAFRSYMDKEVDLLRRQLAKAKAGKKATTVKSIEKKISALEAKIEAAVKARYDENSITFEDLGIDYVMVDEAHRFKNLPFSSSAQGVQSPEGADRARDLHMKLEVLRDRAKEKGGPKRITTFATGTPISNSLMEMYAMERMLAPDLLEEAGVADADSWIATFASIEKKVESDNSSTGYLERIRFRGFTDGIGDGLRIWRSFTDTVTAKYLEEKGYIKRPKVKGGARQIHVVERTPEQDAVRASLKDRIDRMVGRGKAKKGDDIHVAVINDGRAMAIDPRLMSERGLREAGIDPDDDNIAAPKLDKAADNLTAIWQREKDSEFRIDGDDPDSPMSENRGALQMVFIDSSAPKRDQINAYNELKKRLVARGMDPKRIRFVQEAAQKPEVKARMMDDARQGKIDVLIGSSEALGTGTNAQNRLVALHHIEGSWQPKDIEQREGRGLRQGNQYDEVEIHAYVTKGTHDEKTWDMVAFKQNGLDELQNGGYDSKAIEFADDVDPMTDFEVIAGNAAEDPLAIDMRELSSQLKGLNAAKRQFDQRQSRARAIIDDARQDDRRLLSNINDLDRALQDRVDVSGDKFRMKVRADEYGYSFADHDDRTKAATQLGEALTGIFNRPYFQPGEGHAGIVGDIGGFRVRAWTINEGGRPPRIELDLIRNRGGDYQPGLPLQRVVVGRDDVKTNMRGVLQRLEQRLSSMQDRRDGFEADRAKHAKAITDAEDTLARPFRQADELENTQRRLAVVNKLLDENAKNDQGETLTVDARDSLRKEYDNLKGAASNSPSTAKKKITAGDTGSAEEVLSRPSKKADYTPRPKPAASGPAKSGSGSSGSGGRGGSGGGRGSSAPAADGPDGDGEKVSLDPKEVQDELDGLGTGDVAAPKAPEAPKAPKGDKTPEAAATPDPENLPDPEDLQIVDSVNEGQAPTVGTQTAIGGDGMPKVEINEDFMQQQDMTPAAPKPVDEPAKQDGPSLFDEPDTDAPAAANATPQGDAPADTTPGRPAADATPDADAAAAPEAPKAPDAPDAPEAPAAPKAKTPRKPKAPKAPKERAPEIVPTPEDPFGIEQHIGEWKPNAVASSKWGALGPLWSKLGKESPEARAVWVASNMMLGGDYKAKGADAVGSRDDTPDLVDAVERLAEHMRGTHGDSDLADRLDKWVEGYREQKAKTPDAPEAPDASSDVVMGEPSKIPMDERPKPDLSDVMYDPETDSIVKRPEAPDDTAKPLTVDPKTGGLVDDPTLTERAWIDHEDVQAGDKITVDGITGIVTSARNGGMDDRGDFKRAVTIVDADGKEHEVTLAGADQVERHVTPDEKARLDNAAEDLAADLVGDFPESTPPRTPDVPRPSAEDAPEAPKAPKSSKKPLKRDEVTFHEVYGNVSRGQLAAYKKHNVSQSDHDSLVRHYGEDEHERIRQAVLDPANQTEGGSFSDYKWRDGLADEDRLFEATKGDEDVTPDASGAGAGDGGDVTPSAPSIPDEPGDDAPSTPDTLPNGREVPEGKRIVKGVPAGQLVVGDELTNGFKVTGRPNRGTKTPGNKVIVRGNYPGRPEKDYEWNRSTYFNVIRDAKPEGPTLGGTAPKMVGKKKVTDDNGRTKHVLIRDDGKEVDVPESVWNRSDAPDTTPQADTTPEVDEPTPHSDDLPDPAEEAVPDPEPVSIDTAEPAAPAPAPSAPMSEKEKYVRGRIDGEKYDPNPQQGDIYTASVVDGKDVIVEAKAGAGKTSTLEGMARRVAELDPDARILYAAFNKSVQLEAEGRMPSNVETRTGHSLAWNYVGPQMTAKFKKPRMLSNDKDVARHIGITSDLGTMTPREQANAVKKALKKYVLSADDKVEAQHFEIELPDAEMKKLIGYAEKAWEDIKDPNGRLRVSQDDFRKMWALSRPDFTKTGSGAKRRATILFVDEAQDTPPVLAKVFADQKMRKVIVGDPDQAIYGFAGATDYLSKAEGDVRLPLDKSYRYGPQIADAGNRFLQLLKSKSRAIGGGPDSKIVHGMTDADAVLVRSNAGLIKETVAELGRGRTVGVPKGTKTELMSLLDSAAYLRGEGDFPKGGMHEELEPFNTWSEVVKEAEAGDKKLAMLNSLIKKPEYGGVDGLRDIVKQVIEPDDDPLSKVEFDRDEHSITVTGDTFGLNKAVKEALGNPPDGPGMGRDGMGWTFAKDADGNSAWSFAGTPDAQEQALKRLRETLGATDDRPEPDVTISTAHKAKGLEWDRVRIGDDFGAPEVDETTGKTLYPEDAELRLDYVAVTRAAKELDPGSLGWVYEHTDANGAGNGAVRKVDPADVDADLAATGAPERKPDVTPDVAPESAPTAPEPAPQSAPDITPSAPTSAPDTTAPSAPEAPGVDGPRPVKDMSIEDLEAELETLDPQADEDRYIDVFTELDARDMAGNGALGQRGQGRGRVGEARGEVHDDNARIVDRGWDDSQGGMAPSEGLHFLPERYRKTLLDGGKVPANVIGKYVPEETTMHVWGMTPKEMSKHGFTHYGIPGAVKLSDRLGEKSGTKIDDPKGVLSRDVADLHDDELDEAIDLVKRAGDDEHLEWLGMEQARRAQLSDEDRKREDEDRRDRREADDEGDDALDDDVTDEPAAGEGDAADGATPNVPDRDGDVDADGGAPDGGAGSGSKKDEPADDEHPVEDKTDAELDDHDDKDAAKKERERRDALNEDEREKDERDRHRRRRNRRRRRRNRRNHGGRNKPHPRLPHLPRPHNKDDKQDAPGATPKAGAKPSDGSDAPGKMDGPTIDGRDADKVEDTLAQEDAVAPIREDGTLTPASAKDGVDMTPDERADEDAAIDEAYGDHAPSMERDAVVDEGVKPDYLPQEQWDDLQSHAAPLRDAGLPIAKWRSGNEYGRPWAAFDVNDAVTGDHLGVSISLNDKGNGYKISGTFIPVDGGGTTLRGKDLAKKLDELAKSPAERERLGMGPIAATSELIPNGDEGTPFIVGLAKKTGVGRLVQGGKLTRARNLQPGDVIGIGSRELGEVLSVDEVPYPGRGPRQVILSLKPSDESGKPATIRTSPSQNWGVYSEWEPANAAPAVDVTPEAPAVDATPSADVTPEAPAGLPRLDDLVVTPDAPASAPNTPAATESAPSLPGADTPDVAPAAPEADFAPGNPFGRRLPDGLNPEQARVLLTPGPDGTAKPVAIVTEDGQLHIGTPVAHPDGSFRGVEVAPGVVDEFAPADVRTVRAVDVTPEAAQPSIPSAPVDEYGPPADTPIPDGLSVPAEPLPDAFAPSDRPEATVPTTDRPRPLTPAPATDRGDAPTGGSTGGRGDAPQGGTAETVVEPEGSKGPIAPKPARRERPGWAKRAREAAQKRADRRRAQDEAARDSYERSLEDTPESVDDAKAPSPAEVAQGQVAAYVSPVTLQIGDYARVEGYDVNGAKASTAGFLMNDPQPVLADLGDGEVDMLAVTVSDEYDGLGITRTIYVPLDSMASLAPRPNMDDVPDEGWLMDDNRLKVRDNRMPDRIPTDRGGMGLFPGSIVADRRRSGRVVQARGQDVTVMWDDSDEQESRAGATLNVVDGGAARPDGWSVDGRRVTRLGKPGANGRRTPGRRGGQRSDGRTVSEREAMSESEALAQDLFDRIEKATRRIQRGNLSRRQQEQMIRQLAREAVEASTRRRADAARRIAGAYPHRPGLLAQIVTWLQRLATAVVEALVTFWLAARDGWRDGQTGIASNARRKESVDHAIEAASKSRAKRGLDALLEGEEAA